MPQNLELPTISFPSQATGDSTESPSRQIRSMSVAVPAGQSPLATASVPARLRTNSLPNPAFLLGFTGCRDPRTCCVRSFTTTAKGVINAGDIVRKTSVNSLMFSGSTAPQIKTCSLQSFLSGDRKERLRTFNLASNDNTSSVSSRPYAVTSAQSSNGRAGVSYFRVAIQGDEGVGKTALTRQFSSSEYMGTYDNSTSTDGDLTEKTVVPVLLDGEESIMEFIDGAEAYQMDDINVDAYIVVFSIVDRNSFIVASDFTRQLRVNLCSDRAIILVGNKSDLVRKRKVSAEEAKDVATAYDCKYFETSAALNHQIDDLVAGTLAQIRLQLTPHCPTLLSLPPTKTRSRTPSPVSFFNKFFKRNIKGSASCEGIFMK